MEKYINALEYFKSRLEATVSSMDVKNMLAEKPTPKVGWIRVIRQAFGMTGKQLAQRMGCTQSNVAAFERSEQTGNISLNSLEQAAKAMNCCCVYFFVPQKPLNQIMEDQARLVAKKRLKSVAHSMSLEQQSLTPEQTKQQEDSLVSELLWAKTKFFPWGE